MGKRKKDGIKNIYCSTCEKWMTEFYVSRHIHSKFHFTKKFFATEHLHKKQSQTKRLKKRQSGANKNCKQKKITATVQSDYQQYKIKGGTIQNCSCDVEDLDLRKATNLSPSTNLEVNNETPNLDMGQVSQDYLPVSQNCRTPENEEIFAFHWDTLKNVATTTVTFFLEGCSDMQSTDLCAPHDREQVNSDYIRANISKLKGNQSHRFKWNQSAKFHKIC